MGYLVLLNLIKLCILVTNNRFFVTKFGIRRNTFQTPLSIPHARCAETY
jgi:hypothetical protein